MEIIVNGKREVLQKEQTLRKFLEAKGLDLNKIVVEYNSKVVQQDDWQGIVLKENDALEVLKFVGGG